MQKQKLKTIEYTYTAMYEPIKEGGYTVIVPALTGLVTYGRTFEEAQMMVRDAIICHLEAMEKDDEEIPQEASVVQEKVSIRF